MTDCSRRNQLIAAIRAQRDDPTLYHVYADFLNEADDPHGALVARQLQVPGPIAGLDLPAADRAWLARHAGHILGRLAWWLDQQHDAGGRALTWRWGFIESMTLSARFRPVLPLVDAAFEAPAAQVLRSFTISARGAVDSDVVDRIAQVTVPLETLRFGELDEPNDRAWNRLLARTDWPLHTLTVGGGFTPQSGARFIELLAESALLPQLRVVRLPGGYHQLSPFSITLDRHRDAFRHLHELQLYSWRTPEPALEELAADLGNVRVQRSPKTFLPATVRDWRHYRPPATCPLCGSTFERARLETGRIICPTCSGSFEPHDRFRSGFGPPPDYLAGLSRS